MSVQGIAHDGDSSASGPVFGMPQAIVILGFLSAAVILRLITPMTVRDIVALLVVAGIISVIVLLAAGYRRRSGHSLLRRLLNAALTSGSGN
ncbi:hypothetical protein ACWDQ0_30900 [Streptomyces sp. NPDC003642]